MQSSKVRQKVCRPALQGSSCSSRGSPRLGSGGLGSICGPELTRHATRDKLLPSSVWRHSGQQPPRPPPPPHDGLGSHTGLGPSSVSVPRYLTSLCLCFSLSVKGE